MGKAKPAAVIETLADLTPDPRNARRHNPRNVGMLEKALGEVGAARSIVIDEQGVVLAGNATIEAAARAGIEKVQVVDADGETIIAVRRTGLTAKQKTRLALYDNRTAELADWDADVIADLLATERELLDGLFADDELAELLEDFSEPETVDAEPQIDRAAELNKKWQVKPGDLWRVGEHRLLCGDSTKREDVERVMGGEKALFVFTDPPYGVAYSGRGASTSQQTIENDDLDPAELKKFLLSAFSVMPCEKGCNIFICHADRKRGRRSAFEDAFFDAGFVCNTTVIWVKNVASMGWQDFRQGHEPIMFGWLEGGERMRVEDRSLTTVWPVGREGNYMHPTTKPVELVAYALNACSRKGMICWDSFLGSGTTMVACENLHRKCRGIEISADYCAVILERMATAFPALAIERA